MINIYILSLTFNLKKMPPKKKVTQKQFDEIVTELIGELTSRRDIQAILKERNSTLSLRTISRLISNSSVPSKMIKKGTWILGLMFLPPKTKSSEDKP